MSAQDPTTTQSLEDLLSRHPLFTDLPHEYSAVLLESAREVVYEPGQVIFREGDTADGFFLVLEGKVVLEAFNIQYGSTPVQELEAGEVFGWSVLVPPHRWRLDARAAERTRLAVLDGEQLRLACEKDPGLGYALLQRFAMILDQRLQAVRRQLVERHIRSW